MRKASGLICAGGLLVASAFAADITISVDTTKTGTTVPANFLGFSFTRQYINGPSGMQRLFDRNAYISANGSDTNYVHLTNLIKQLGIKHYRTICSEADTTNDPSASDDDIFFQFCSDAALTNGIYSLHLYSEGDVNAANTSNTTAAQHILNVPTDLQFVEAFAFDNESDWNYRIRATHNTCPDYDPTHGDPYITDYSTSCGTDPNFSGMSPGFKGKWEKLKSQVSALTNGSAAKFVGPDTGSSWWGTGDTINTDTSVLPHPGGVPFSLQFAHDETTRIISATQHHYEKNDADAPEWIAPGDPLYPATYLTGDMVLDPSDADPKSGIERMYQAAKFISASNTHPKAAQAGNWTAMESIWVSGNTYAIGDHVFDDSTNGDGNIYECVVAGQSNVHPSDKSPVPWHWKVADRGDYGFLSSHQLSISMADPVVVTNWSNLWSGALAGKTTGSPVWPSGKPFRMTEFSPYSGGQNPAAGNFASALWGLEAFHWWARKGAAGVDPHSRPVQTNSPIFQSGGNYADFSALPYGYAYAAFNLSAAPGTGKALWTSNGGFSFANNTGYNVSGYGVVTSGDLFVTVINKTFDYDRISGSHTITATINAPTGYRGSVRYIAMNSGGAAGDSTVLGAKIGGSQILNTNTSFTPSWTTGSIVSNTVTITVPAFSAMIVDLKP